MKLAILISLILHLAVLWTAPRHENGAAARKPGSPAVSYLGALGDDIFPERSREAPERKAADYPGFRPPEAEAAVIDPPAFGYEAGWAPPEPALTIDEIKALSEETALVEKINIFESYLEGIEIESIPCRERILP